MKLLDKKMLVVVVPDTGMGEGEELQEGAITNAEASELTSGRNDPLTVTLVLGSIMRMPGGSMDVTGAKWKTISL